MATKQYIDGRLVTWGSELFYGKVKSRYNKPKNILSTNKTNKGNQRSEITAHDIRSNLRSTFKKVPEVNIKITGSGKHIKQIKNHLDYISRNGEKPLEDQDGNLIIGKSDVRNLRDLWQDGRHVIPLETGYKRETFNIVFSMPPGTDRLGVHNAVRDFAKEQFSSNHEYVFVSHDDTDHPHAHLVVKAVGFNGKRLNPRKSDLQKWRQRFAERLREHGIEANATSRRTRGIIKYPRKKSVIEAEKRGRPLKYYRDPNQNHDNPYSKKTLDTHKNILHIYKEIAQTLQNSPDKDDRKLAVELVKFVASTPYQLRDQSRQRALEPNANNIRKLDEKDIDR